jgi:GDP-L-fucose synthase
MYGPNDTYDLEGGHFIPTLIKKFVDTRKKGLKELTFWGTGTPRREALYVDDCADACIYLMKNYNSPDIINIGTGFDYSIKEYIGIMKEVLDYNVEIKWDLSKPDGVYEKRTDISKLKKIMPEFNPRIFEDGVREVLRLDFGLEV